ncbi:iron export ABC transporter permease subunit FetB [Lujinxingia litoralis]|uniref:Iron export ABC transporter permease subunit FetB n=1 Tax=Lujinxingia litoralis TaxID=2211119 RepID=A0A328C268_9DELT|nr:iron export ABC transporter permease subunit FetB [Lujinxingia litoralis]RAL20742.1 iron export ABC transporter permease subunit FetB [Lujinxingia litoralis]
MTYVQLSPLDLAIAALLLLIPALISLALKLGLQKSLAIAALRTVVQLSLLGLILEWVFEANRWYYVLPMLLVMLIAAARAAISRSARQVPGSHITAFASLTLATSLTTFAITELVIGADPWFTPQYVIPLLGMLLGNGLTGISLGLDRMLSDIVLQRPAIEARLAMGSSLWEASRQHLKEGVRNGMIPIINAMMVVGLVSLPGMMTGQILAGADPADAVAYQILIMFMIAAATALGTITLCLLTFRRLAHPMARLRWDIITHRDETPAPSHAKK